MWFEADKYNTNDERLIHSISDLTDEEYKDALVQVNPYFRLNTPLRKAWNIEEFKGPQGIEDRGTALEDYTGGSARWKEFKYYTFNCFCSELRNVRAGAIADTAT